MTDVTRRVKTRNFQELRKQIDADPVRRARSDRMYQALVDGDKLAALREQRAGTQRVLAEAADVSQARISQVEHGDDLYLSTLAWYIEALGGRLEIAAVFPDERIELTAPPAD